MSVSTDNITKLVLPRTWHSLDDDLQSAIRLPLQYEHFNDRISGFVQNMVIDILSASCEDLSKQIEEPPNV